ncbi:hypothetical protein CDAR_583701 [Caerostris darwini]|uniref:Uncharacterized protein n=1 Tax=Caerostris darwini TaxID=1538125 RepID=A0AAV4QU19_9ARAC|nr:hypothetical protein CDAR_583701 [Caerostris darwini]
MEGEGKSRAYIYVLRKNGSIQKNRNPGSSTDYSGTSLAQTRVGHKCRYRVKKRLPWRRDPRIPPALPLFAVSTFVTERRWKFCAINSSERDKRRAVVLLFGSSYSRLFLLFIYLFM